MAAQAPHSGPLLQDCRHFLDTEGTDARALVLLLHDQVIGVAVLRTEWEAQHLEHHYTSKLGNRPVRLHHLLLAPVFQRFARHFLAQVLRHSAHTSLVHPVYRATSRSTEALRYSPLSVLDELSMAAPRRTLPLPGPRILPPFAVFQLSLTSALLPSLQDTRRLLVIGEGPAALSCVETLAARSRCNRPNLTLVTRDDVEQDYGPSVLNMAPPVWGRAGSARAARLSLRSVVNLVPGKLVWIDREGARVGLQGTEGEQSLHYDRLVLCLERSHYSLPVARLEREAPSNYCVPDCLQAAARALHWLQGCSMEARKKEGYIIVIGLNLHSLAVVNSLLEAGAPPSCILLVKTEHCTTGLGAEPWHEDGAIRNRVLNSLRLLGVRVKAYSLVDCRRDKAKGVIEAVIFSKGEELVEAGCMLLVNCSQPCVSPRLGRVLEEADLVYLQGGLVTNSRYRTSDRRLRAGGSGTRLGRMALARAGGKEPQLAPAQVGRLLAQSVLEEQEHEDEEDKEEEEENEEDDGFPVHREAQLPGGLTYLHLSTGHPTQTRLTTSCPESGEFRLAFDSRERVCAVHCLARGCLASSHLTALHGCHRSLLTGLDQGIEDLFTYFQQPHVLALLHDR